MAHDTSGSLRGLIHETGIYYLQRRIALVEDASGALVASGEYTLSGEAAPIEAFRAP